MQNFLFFFGGGAVNKLYYGLCEGHEWAEFTSLPPGGGGSVFPIMAYRGG